MKREQGRRRDALAKRVRMETGVMQFKGDWPGLFIRGDDAIRLMLSVRAVLNFAEKSLPPSRLSEIAMHLQGLAAIANLIDRDVVV